MVGLAVDSASINADRIVPRLWQGANPPQGVTLKNAGVQLLVLCAEELQYPDSAFPGVLVLRAPMQDSRSVPVETAMLAAEQVARAWKEGLRCLVCCHMGLNRSGLVTALTLWRATGASGRRCAAMVREKRYGALSNPWFSAYLDTLLPRGLPLQAR